MSFNDDDNHDWRVVATDENGRLYFDTKRTVKRRKKHLCFTKLLNDPFGLKSFTWHPEPPRLRPKH
jgi:hypothetical protein